MAFIQKNSSMFKKVFVFLLTIIIFSFCSEDTPTEPENSKLLSDKITLGNETKELTQDISPAGGKIIISNKESVLNGMEIIIPEKGYKENRTYTITSSPIKEHKLGEYFNPVTPMITIKNGGGYSEMPITIKIPINKKDDEFLMGVFFNEITGELEPLPVIELDNSFITVETRHFALSEITSGNKLGKVLEIDPIANLIISSIKESILAGQIVINSGFTPGIDDWEFINYGSYIAPKGHCAGQSLTAMWYYYEKKLKGEPSLFHQFDQLCQNENPRFLWQDNPLGYRLASTVQADAIWSGWAFKIQQYVPDPLVWKTFITAMLLTGSPQFVGILNTIIGGGHAMIVYKINVREGKLYVADPNYPNNRSPITSEFSIRTITYANNKFQPYPSYANAGEPGKEYDQIKFYAVNTFVDWTKIGERYKEFEDKTIGNDRFKEYNLFVKLKTQNIPFSDGMEVSEDTLKLFCKNDNIPEFLPGTDRLQMIHIYNANGNYVLSANEKGLANFVLNEGENKFGIYICGYYKNKPIKFYDFKWVTVNYITEPTLEFNHCGISIYLGTKYTYTTPDTSYQRENNKTHFGTWESYHGSFSGHTFNASYSRSWDSQTNPLVITGNLTATFNSDYTVITNISWTESRNVHFTTFEGIDIPLDTYEWGTVYQVKMEETCNHITTLSDVQSVSDGLSWTTPEYWCNGDSRIFISFSKE